MSWHSTDSAGQALQDLFDRRVEPVEQLLGDAEAVARACHDMARRFQAGGKLIVFGNGGPSTDAQHVAVEFVHPVIVGKRALPALSLTSDVATVTGIARGAGIDEVFAHQIRCLGEPDDIVIGISADGDCENVLRGLAEADRRGLLSIGLAGGEGGAMAGAGLDHVLIAHSGDARVVKEVHVTIYHVLWELVHVFLEQPGVWEAA